MTHEHEYEHLHYDELGNEIIEEHRHSLFRADRRELRSVGIDIGSTTSHLIFSTLVLRRQSAALSSRFEVAERRVDYASPIMITPFAGGTSIDTGRLSAFFERAYAESGTRADEVDTGAVITTGDAARKDNAQAIVRLFSERAGNFVCASAGPVLEARMAAYGSGAIMRSLHGDDSPSVLNIDVGGGTSKLAVVREGRIEAVAAVNVGARLITLDEDGVIMTLEEAASVCARHRGLDLRCGEPADDESLRALATALAESLLEVAAGGGLSPLASELMITEPFAERGPVDVVFFSGGVSEYFYRETSEGYGDIGARLADAIRERSAPALPEAKIELSRERIRATVIGASQFTVQLSGNTIHIANPALLPLRSLRVVMTDLERVELHADAIGEAIEESFSRVGVERGEESVALALRWPHGPAYAHLEALCEGIAGTLSAGVRAGQPVVVVLDADVSRLVGENLSRALGRYRDIICIDGVQLQDFDYIDISREHEHTHTVTVVIKSLVFSG